MKIASLSPTMGTFHLFSPNISCSLSPVDSLIKAVLVQFWNGYCLQWGNLQHNANVTGLMIPLAITVRCLKCIGCPRDMSTSAGPLQSWAVHPVDSAQSTARCLCGKCICDKLRYCIEISVYLHIELIIGRCSALGWTKRCSVSRLVIYSGKYILFKAFFFPLVKTSIATKHGNWLIWHF